MICAYHIMRMICAYHTYIMRMICAYRTHDIIMRMISYTSSSVCCNLSMSWNYIFMKYYNIFYSDETKFICTISYQYYNLRYNPSAPFVCSGFLVSYRIRSSMKTTAPRTATHLTYIQGIVFRIKLLSRYWQWTRVWIDNEKMAIIRDF